MAFGLPKCPEPWSLESFTTMTTHRTLSHTYCKSVPQISCFFISILDISQNPLYFSAINSTNLFLYKLSSHQKILNCHPIFSMFSNFILTHTSWTPSRICFDLRIDIEIWSVFISSHFETLHPAHPLNFKLLSFPSLLGTSKAAVLQPCKHIIIQPSTISIYTFRPVSTKTATFAYFTKN